MIEQEIGPPWRLHEHNESFEIRTRIGTRVAYIYFEDEPVRRSTMGRFSKAAAREIALAILKLPSMMGWK